MNTNEVPAYINVQAIKAEYAPYHKFEAFDQGFTDYLNGATGYTNKFDGVKAQAYDRGAEAAMRVFRASQWIEQNVGAN